MIAIRRLHTTSRGPQSNFRNQCYAQNWLWRRFQFSPTTSISCNKVTPGPMDGNASTIWPAIVERYDHAQSANASSMSETSTDALEDGGVRFLLRVAAKLRDKPEGPKAATGSTPDEKKKKSFVNPFLPPDPDLFVQHLSPSHSLVLNKFNIVEHHVLVITKDFERQEDPISLKDFEATLDVLKAMPRGGLAYFNTGPLSGASQPHKHLQVVPLPIVPSATPLQDDPPLWPVVREAIRNSKAYDIIQIKTLPFVNYTVPLTLATCTADDLTNAYNGALEQLNSFVAANKNADLKQVPVSYNMVLTPTYMMLIPRQQERIGPVSCNAVAFAGSFFVRSTDELEYIKSQGPMHVLQQVGYSW